MDYDDVYELLVRMGLKYDFRPDIPLEAESLMRDLVASYNGPEQDFSLWLETEVKSRYRSIGRRPEWIQDPDWPLAEARPMVFVGQIDVPSGATQHLKHDASFYVFWDPLTGRTAVVVQSD